MKLPKKEIKLRKRNQLVHGVGINDADYLLTESINVDGKQKVVWTCPIYRIWRHMLERCYCQKYLNRKPSYLGCSVCEEWKYFMKFREWVLEQDYEGKQLDKDLLIVDNKIYSPDTCLFVHTKVNNFVTDRKNDRGVYMLGVDWDKNNNKFRARCCNPFTVKQEYLGLFTNELDAHLAWKARKHELACQLADSAYCTDPRLAQALKTRYL